MSVYLHYQSDILALTDKYIYNMNTLARLEAVILSLGGISALTSEGAHRLLGHYDKPWRMGNKFSRPMLSYSGTAKGLMQQIAHAKTIASYEQALGRDKPATVKAIALTPQKALAFLGETITQRWSLN